MVRLATKQEANEPLMTEEQLYEFLELKMPREEMASIQMVQGDYVIISDGERKSRDSG